MDFSVKKAKWSLSSKLVLTGFIMLLIQICYGSFTAGLKAGYISDTWPLILGQLVPSGLLSQLQPPLMNLIAAPLTVLFIHRWFAFVGLITAIFFYWLIQKQNVSKDIKSALNLILNFGHHPNCIGNLDCPFACANRDCITASSQCPAALFCHNLSSSSSARR